MTNQRVQGFAADEKGNIVNKMTDIKFPRALIPAKATKELKLDLNLDSRMEATKKFDPKDPIRLLITLQVLRCTILKVINTWSASFFNKTADREWEYKGLVDGKEISGGEEGSLSQVCSGKLTFTVDGKLDSQELSDSSFNFKGGALQGQQVKINFGDAIQSWR